MTDTNGIIQSANRAWRLLNTTGLFDMSRGLYTEAYQRNLREAVRELREAARSLVRPNNLDAYGELDESNRLTLWKSIMRARAPATGEYIYSRLGLRHREIPEDIREARRLLSSQSNGFPGRELMFIMTLILNAAPDARTILEQQAARDGDPMPPGITTAEAELYQRIMLAAIANSSREASRYRNAGEAAMETFGQTLLPALPTDPNGMRAFGQDQVEGALATAVSRGSETAVRESAQSIGAIVSLIRAVTDAADAHYRMNNPEYRLNHWVHQGCLAETGNNGNAAVQMIGQLQNIRERMDAWLQWLERHHDHPSYVPPGGRWEAAPTASLDTSRTGAANHSGPVRGAVRGAANRGSTGLA